MPAAVCLHCILHAKDLGMLAFVLGLCRWSGKLGRLLVVYYRIVQISRLNLHTFPQKPAIYSLRRDYAQKKIISKKMGLCWVNRGPKANSLKPLTPTQAPLIRTDKHKRRCLKS